MKKIFVAALILLLAPFVHEGETSQNWQPKESEKWIKINKEQLRLTLYTGTKPLKTWQVSVGKGRGTVKKSRLDLITPSGTFTIYRILEDASKLVYDPAWFDEPGKPEQGVYGSKLISFYNKWQIAIHGTNNPSSVGKWTTHGCIRLRNRDIEELVKDVAPKMKLVIVERDDGLRFYKETI